jgi:hypothetical protein
MIMKQLNESESLDQLKILAQGMCKIGKHSNCNVADRPLIINSAIRLFAKIIEIGFITHSLAFISAVHHEAKIVIIINSNG